MPVESIASRAVAASAPVPSPHCANRARFADVFRALHPATPEPRSTAPALRSLEQVERAQQRLDQILAEARSGRTFTGAELLALQAEAHRFSHTVELASKVIEQGSQSVKQAVNTPL